MEIINLRLMNNVY